jgi:hypothetical protein
MNGQKLEVVPFVTVIGRDHEKPCQLLPAVTVHKLNLDQETSYPENISGFPQLFQMNVRLVP